MTKWPMTLALATLALGAGACESSPALEPAKADGKAGTEAEAKADGKAGTEVEAKADGKAGTEAEAKADAKADAGAEAPPAEPTPELAAEPPRPAGLVPSPLPGVKDAKTPAVVFVALPDRETHEWEVDIVDFSGMSMKRLEKKLQADLDAEWKRRTGEEGGDEEEGEGQAGKEPPNLLATKAGESYVPAGFAVGDPWTLVSTRGVEHRTATGFRAVLMEGSGEVHFYVRLGKAPKGVGELEPTLAFRGKLPTTARLAVPKAVTPVAVGPDVLDHLVAAVVPRLEPGQQESFGAEPIQPSDVKLYPGRFPGKRTHAAFLAANEHDEESPPISAFAFVKADGSVEVVVIPDVLGRVELVGLLDVDGDGFDEVFYTDAYHEGWYAMMMQWDGETPRPRTLTGDGI